MRDVDSFRIHDASIHAWTKDKPRKGTYPTREEEDWVRYNAACSVLEINGFGFHQDPRYRDGYWKSLRRTHHAGSKGDVHFASEVYNAGFSFEFYEDVPRDNKNGGRYSFDKMGQASYLWRKRVELIHTKLANALLTMGFEDHTDPVLDGAHLEVMERRRQHMDWHSKHYESPPSPYNSKDQDGVLMKGGETRYFYTRNGRLQRGRVYRDLNNVWPIVMNRNEWTCQATFELFTYDPDKHPRKLSKDPLVKINRALERAVRDRNFAKAARIQEAMHRKVDSYEFRVGDHVMVDNPRFHGTGIVDSIDPPFKVWVKLSNGNTWAYEWATVKPLKEAAATT